MHCWDCNRVLPVPERTLPTEPGDKYSQSATVDISCGCGAIYMITTVRKPNRVQAPRPMQTEAEIERGRLWRNED